MSLSTSTEFFTLFLNRFLKCHIYVRALFRDQDLILRLKSNLPITLLLFRWRIESFERMYDSFSTLQHLQDILATVKISLCEPLTVSVGTTYLGFRIFLLEHLRNSFDPF